MALHDGRPLTPIEERIALLVAAGLTDAEVAAKLGLSDKTVEWHLARASRKLGVRSRGDLAAVIAGGSRGRVAEEAE
jgi:DNA-binding CsgD family transcriptional regulator